MTSIINTGGSSVSGILIHDLHMQSLPLADEGINVSGDGEIKSIRMESAVLVAVGILVAGNGPWRVHDCQIRTDDTALVVDADSCVITGNWLSGDTAGALIVNGDDNVIVGNFFRTGVFVNGDDNTIVGNTIRMFNGPDNAVIVAGDRNYVGDNRYVNDAGGTPSAVGLEIVSGATDTIVGVNDFAQATLPITDAGTGTIYKNTRELTWTVAGTLSTGTGVDRRRLPEDVFIIDAATAVDTAPTDATLIVDFHLNGTTIFTTQGNRPTVAIAGNDSGLAIPDVTAGAAAQYLTMDIDQIGSTVAGADLTGIVRYVNVGVTG